MNPTPSQAAAEEIFHEWVDCAIAPIVGCTVETIAAIINKHATAELAALKADNERMSDGEKWIASMLCEMMAVATSGFADGAVVAHQKMDAGHTLAVVRMCAEHAKKWRAELTTLRRAGDGLAGAMEGGIAKLAELLCRGSLSTQTGHDALNNMKAAAAGWRSASLESQPMILFTLPIDPPRATSQMKGVMVVGGRPRFFKKAKVKKAENMLLMLLREHAPDGPLTGPLRVSIAWRMPWRKSETKARMAAGEQYSDTRPDLDNAAKLICDCMSTLRFWHNDSQIADLHLSKKWADHPGITVSINQIP